MVDTYDISADRKTYTFTLRDGLKFHDGSPVTTKDVIASLRRWGATDGVGQRLLVFTENSKPIDDKTFRLVLREPYGLVLESLGKTRTSVPSSCARRTRSPTRNTQVTEAIGSGPFKFAKDQWVPGSKTVYLKNADYVPRPGNEPPSSFSGSKIPKVDRIELVWISDPQTAMSALVNGEVDFYEVPTSTSSRSCKRRAGEADEDRQDQLDLRPDPAQSSASAVQQHQGAAGDVSPDQSGGFLARGHRRSEYYTVCHGLIMCGSPLQNDGGSAMLKDYNPKKALQLLKEAGYKGEPITVLAATDHATITPATQVLIQAMREAGINVDAQAMDWGSVVWRRARKEPPAQGGWNIFVTTSGGVGGASDPAYVDRRGLRQRPVRLAVRCRGRKAAQRLRFRADRRREEEGSPATCRRGRSSRWSTSRSASGRHRSPIAPTASTGSCRTPAWSCCGTSARSRGAKGSDPNARPSLEHHESHGV